MAVLMSGVLAFCFTACLVPDSSSSSSLPQSVSSSQVAEPALFSPVMPAQRLDINMLTGGERPENMQDGQRPVSVIVSNNQRALPQRGVAAADVVYEMVTEGGITRLMAMYADYATLPEVGPVRSNRDQFLQLSLPSDAIPVQIGASVYANNLLTTLSYKAVDGIQVGRTAFYFDEARAHPKPEGKLNEYCWYTNASLLWDGMTMLDVLTTGDVPPLFWFADDAAATDTQAYTVTLNYSAVMGASFLYDEASGLYQKNIFFHEPEYAETPHADEDGVRLAFTNLIVLSCPVSLKPDGMVTEFDFSAGEGYYFTAGGVQKIIWQKGDVMEPLRLYTPDGQMLQVQRGKSYIGVISDDNPDAVLFAPKIAEDPLPTEKSV